MKKILPIFFVGLLIISGLGAGSYNDHDPIEIEKVAMPTKYDMGIMVPDEFSDSIQPFNNNLFSNSINYQGGPQEEWNKTYGGEQRDFFRSGIKLVSGNHIVNGVHGITHDNSYSEWWLVNIDSFGDLIWEKTFDGPGYCNGLLQASDGGYILVGSYSSFPGDENVRLIKTGSGGNLEWSKTFGGSGYESVHNIQNTEDGGFVIVGWTESFGDESRDLWLIKTDSNGNEEWNKTYGGDGLDGGDHIIQLNEEGYMIVGITTSYGAGGFDVWLIKTDINGNMEWSDTFGGIYDDFINGVERTADGGFILVGTTQQSESDDNIWLLKFNEEEILEWEKSIGDSTNNEHGNAILTTPDGSYIVAGDHRSRFITGNQQGLLMKVDLNGYIEWSTLFGGPDEDSGNNIIQTYDGGYIVFGLTGSYGAGDWDGWLVKFSADDNQRPNKPLRPSGEINGKTGIEYIYTTSTTDPDSDDVFYLFDWGDGSTSFILGPYDSGVECKASNVWFDQGNYDIKVKAIDEHGAESEWSEPLVVSMPKAKCLNNINMLRLFNLLKYSFPFLSLVFNNLEGLI